MNDAAHDQICCPPFDPALWDGKTFEWNAKPFVRGRVFTFFYMPINFGRVIVRLMASVDRAGAATPDYLCLADHTSKWNMDLYLATDREIPGADMASLSGTFLAKVYEGPYKDTGKWCKDFDAYARAQAVTIDKWYMWYTTCPKCARKYGKNYVVVIARVIPTSAPD